MLLFVDVPSKYITKPSAKNRRLPLKVIFCVQTNTECTWVYVWQVAFVIDQTSATYNAERAIRSKFLLTKEPQSPTSLFI